MILFKHLSFGFFFFLITIILFVPAYSTKKIKTVQPAVPEKEKVQVNFYVMSQCSFGGQALINVIPVLKSFGDRVLFSVNYEGSDNEDGTFNSIHGRNEVQGDIAQLCSAKYEPQKYLGLLFCMNTNQAGVPANWEPCAVQAGLKKISTIKKCYAGNEGKILFSKSIEKSKSAGAHSCPTIIINGKLYDGENDETNITKAICYAYQDEWPEACSNVSPPVQIPAIILNDNRCGAGCDVKNLMTKLKTVFPGLKFKMLDYSNEEGKKLYSESGVKYLPAVLFDQKVKETEGYSNLINNFTNAGNYLKYNISSGFDPEK